MDYKKLEELSKSFTKELDLLKSNLIKARQSEALKNFDGFLTPNEQLSKDLTEEYESGIKELFNGDSGNAGYKYDSAVGFFTYNTEMLKELNNFFEEARKRGEIKEQILKLLKNIKVI